MRIIDLLFFLILTQTCFAQFKLTKLDKNSTPKNIHFIGKIVQGLRWTDISGDNIVVLSAEIRQIKNVPYEGYTDGALYAYHYIVSGDSIRQTWRVYDFVKECTVDMFLYFIDKAFAVTDLNQNGKAEVWIMYKVSCQGDVSPVPMKIIMYENNKKFSVRGTTKVTDHMGGDFTFDAAFKNAPAEFRQYAEKLWKQYKVETWKQ